MASCDEGGKVRHVKFIVMYALENYMNLNFMQVAVVGIYSAKGNNEFVFDQPIKVQINTDKLVLRVTVLSCICIWVRVCVYRASTCAIKNNLCNIMLMDVLYTNITIEFTQISSQFTCSKVINKVVRQQD